MTREGLLVLAAALLKLKELEEREEREAPGMIDRIIYLIFLLYTDNHRPIWKKIKFNQRYK